MSPRPYRGLVILPAYNEAPTIEGVLRSVRAHAPGFDVLVVDDGSSDGTPEAVRRAGAWVVEHPFNLGYGGALQTGYKFAAQEGYDVLVQMDADGQHDPAFIVPLAERILTGGLDAAVGSRFLLGEGYIPPLARRIGMVLFAKIASVITRRRVTDPTSGYQALSHRVVDFFQHDVFPTDYPDADMLILLHRAGFRVEEVPVAMQANQTGKSMHNGVLRPMFYVFKMLLSIAVTLLREPPPSLRSATCRSNNDSPSSSSPASSASPSSSSSASDDSARSTPGSGCSAVAPSSSSPSSPSKP